MNLESVLIVVAAIGLDQLLGEAERFHPLAGFGNCASRLEQAMNREPRFRHGFLPGKIMGVLALLILLVPVGLLLVYLYHLAIPQYLFWILDSLLIYLALGRKSLRQHVQKIRKALTENNLPRARQAVSMIVSRDTQQMNSSQVIVASLESLIENSNDAIFGVIFWYLLAGAPAVVIYRLVNTLDAMWGYKNSRFRQFGWAAARLDDVLNWLPARLTVASFALVSVFDGKKIQPARLLEVWQLAFNQGLKCSSKNAGPVMAAGAAALKIKLGGKAEYNGVAIDKPVLGCGNDAQIKDIQRGLSLIDKSLLAWLLLILLLTNGV